MIVNREGDVGGGIGVVGVGWCGGAGGGVRVGGSVMTVMVLFMISYPKF